MFFFKLNLLIYRLVILKKAKPHNFQTIRTYLFPSKYYIDMSVV